MTCPVPNCELKPSHVPYVTDFCHCCGGDVVRKLVLESFYALECNDCGWMIKEVDNNVLRC